MSEIEETKLPGVGVRHDFTTSTGRRVGVISRHAGHRELLIYDHRDPDLCRETVRIDEHDAHMLAEMLGAAQVRSSLEAAQQSVEGMVIEWLPIDDRSILAGRTIGELALRRRTGVTVIAIIREAETIPSPGPEDRLERGDTAIVMSSSKRIADALAQLHDR